MSKMIPIAGPWITEKEIAYVTDAVKNGWYEHANDYVHKFEDAFKSYLGRKFAISLPSCTSALHLSLLALDIGPGDEVIVPDATWIASAAPIHYVGANPVFADIERDTWCLSSRTVKPLITERTKAIIAVNLYGHMPDYDELTKLGVPIIEDAAESIGSCYKRRLSGTHGLMSCFSFHGSKTMTTGEGGMFVTDNEELYKKCMVLRDHGRTPGDIFFRCFTIGYKYKMSHLQAALGLAQIERIDELVGKNREIFDWYREIFDDAVDLNPNHPDTYNSYWMSTAIFQNTDKKQLILDLQSAGVFTRPFFDPLSNLEAFEAFPDTQRAREANVVAYDISRRSINLPSAACLAREDIQIVHDEIIKRIK